MRIPGRSIGILAFLIGQFSCVAQDSQLVTRAYPFGSELFDEIAVVEIDRTEGEFVEIRLPSPELFDLQAYFERAGVPSTEGSFMRYDALAEELVVHNTADNHHMLSRLLRDSHTSCRPTQVILDVTLVRIHNHRFHKILPGTIFTSSTLSEIPDDDVVVLDSTSITTRSGIKAHSKRHGSTNSNTNILFESSLSVTPTVGPERKMVDVTLEWISTRQPDPHSATVHDNISTTLLVSNMVPVVLLTRRGESNEFLECALLTATLVNERGEEIDHIHKKH